VATIDPIGIEDLNKFIKNLKVIDRDLPKAMRLAGNDAVQPVIQWAVPKVPKRSGKAAGSIRAASTQKGARIKAGGSRAPYYAWLDFGGRVGPNKSVLRKFYSDGRYLYPALRDPAVRAEIKGIYTNRAIGVVESAGIEVT
jgi:hypothetical protein